ncbi:MAG: aminotransferase class IV [Phycisphaerales bacterium]
MIVHLNGQLIPAAEAKVSPFDRGFIFGDGIYEGLRAAALPGGRRVVGMQRHVRRMTSGLRQAGIAWDATELGAITDALLDANGLNDAFIYWQVTRGTPDLVRGPVRSRVPAAGMKPTVFGYCSALPPIDLEKPTPAIKSVAIRADLRWSRGDVKCVSLLGNVLEALAAHAEYGADEAILVREVGGQKLVTEGTYTNVVLVHGHGAGAKMEFVTPALDSAPMLCGITREILCEVEPRIVQRPVLASELMIVNEVLLIGTTTMVTSVTRLDGRPVGDGQVGPGARELLRVLTGVIARGEDDLVAAASASASRG